MSYKKYHGIEYKTDGIDYSEQMGIAESVGDNDMATLYERQHNAKNLGEGLGYELSFKYTKPEDYGLNNEDYGFIPEDKKTSDIPSSVSDENTSDIPSSTSRSDAMNLLLSDLQKPHSFSYDPASDPLYQNYRSQAERSAKNVSEDVMAQAAAMTGGMPSSYAVSAASQAASRQMQEADNMIPELYRLALEKYNAERSDKYKQLGVLMDLDNTEYNRGVYADDVAYNRVRDALGDEWTQKKWDYMLEGDTKEEEWKQKEWDYMLEEGAKESEQTALNTVMALLSAGIPVPQEQLDAAGLGHLTPESAKEYIMTNAASQQKPQYTSGVSPEPKKLKAVTSSMYTNLEKALTDEETGGIDVFERELAKYNWDEYDIQDVIGYFSSYYGHVKGIYKLFDKYGLYDDVPIQAGWIMKKYTNPMDKNGKYYVDGLGSFTEGELEYLCEEGKVDIDVDKDGNKTWKAI